MLWMVVGCVFDLPQVEVLVLMIHVIVSLQVLMAGCIWYLPQHQLKVDWNGFTTIITDGRPYKTSTTNADGHLPQ